MQIKSKKHFYELAMKGLCGNTPMMWSSVDEYYDDCMDYQIVGIRHMDIGSKKFTPRIHYEKLWIGIALGKIKLTPGKYIISETPKNQIDQKNGLQGELSWFDGRFVLYYTHSLGYMRDALRESGKHAYGITVQNILKSHLDETEYTELMELFDRFSETGNYPVIEFARMRYPMGRLNRNLVIWEIRNGY